MGRKKKFIDKKKSATFQLMARDTSDPNYSSDPSGDRVFVRVDNNNYTPESFFGDGEPDGEDDPNSIFADAPEDEDENDTVGGVSDCRPQNSSLPEHIRKEILELGFPDDGYNYLMHLREIMNTGGGSAYYRNPKANFEQLPRDVKAYDASRVEMPKINDVPEEKSIYSVASRTVNVKLQKVVDPEIAALLDDSDSSKFGSDVEDLEEDFVVRANLAEGEPVDEELDENLSFGMGLTSKGAPPQNVNPANTSAPKYGGEVSDLDIEKPRIRRPLDEQFDMLELQEYGSDYEEECGSFMEEENNCQESRMRKLNHALKQHAPALLCNNQEGDDQESPEVAADVIRRCREYAEKYEEEDPNEDEVFVDESSDESEVWDCETIISTYSTLDNHPGKITAPEARRKKLSETVSEVSGSSSQVITLKGRERLPVDFLPRSKKHVVEKIKDDKDVDGKRTDLPKRKPRSQETKEEKKERKSAIKSERREARQMKKEMKGLYKSEAQRAQKVAAFTAPSSIHLM